MNEIWNAIVVFFKDTVPNFMSTNWLIIESVCMGIILLALVLGIVRHFSHKKMRKENKMLVSEISARDTLLSTKDKRMGDLIEEKKELEKALATNMTNYENALYTKDAEWRGKAQDYEDAIKELNKDIETIESDKSRIQISYDELIIAKTELDTEHLEILNKNEELNRALLSYSERYEELEKKYNALIIENDFLKNFETENNILIKTLRRLKEDEESDAAKAKDAIVALETRLNKKIDATFEAMISKIILNSTKLKNLDDDLSSLKRSELFKIAKKLGITNFATWSNERLIAEIKKYKA